MPYISPDNWLRYVDRSLDQIMQSLLSTFGALVPEITDHTVNNPYVRDLMHFAGMTEQLGYYIDNAAREHFIDHARLYSTGISLSKLLDYRVVGAVPYGVNVKFVLNQANNTGLGIVIPAGIPVATEDGTITYTTTSSTTIPVGATSSPDVPALQYKTRMHSLGNSTGLPDQEFVIPEVAPIKVAHNSAVVLVNGVPWTLQDTLAYSLPTDNHFVQDINEDRDTVIYFGNGFPYGKIPPTGQAITVSVQQTLGSEGYVGANELTNILTSIILPPGFTVTVDNAFQATGGADSEDLESIKRHLPASFRIMRRAVTRRDYKDAAEQVAGVARAGVYFSCGKSVEIYVVPVGGGLASTSLLGGVFTFMDEYRKMITTKIDVFSAGEALIHINAAVNIRPNYVNATVLAELQDDVAEFYSYLHQEIKGKIVIGDVYEIIENHEAVINSVVTNWYIEPVPRPSTTGLPTFLWAFNSVSAALTAVERWRIVFVTANTFYIIRNSTTLGIHNTGVLIVLPGISFTVLPNGYSSGNTYEFATYPFNAGTIQLVEPNLPVALQANVKLTVTGGM